MDRTKNGKSSAFYRIKLPAYILRSFISRLRENVFPVIKGVKNWPRVLTMLATGRTGKVYFRDGTELFLDRNSIGRFFTLLSISDLMRMKEKYDIQIRGDIVRCRIGKHELRMPLFAAPQTINEFSSLVHSNIDVKDKVVVDIGAYVADTTVYYLVGKGARKVYAYEPVPYLYKLACENVRLNKLQKKAEVFNLGVAGKRGYAYIDPEFTNFGRVERGGKKKKTEKIRIITLDDVVDKFKIRNGVLKVDCEGCEYGIIKSASSRAIKAFDSIHIEYHYGPEGLVERFEKEGYQVMHTKPVYNFKGLSAKPMRNGDLIAIRKPL
jgi:FkbM family methyltransferase